MTHRRDTNTRRCGRYVLLERLGEGGMAEVYKARLAVSEGADRVLVVKLLPANADPTASARFIDEAKIALPLTHGNITATFEFGRADNRPFLVMEYVHGRSLRKILDVFNLSESNREKASVATALFLGREVARALRYAHRFVNVDGKLTSIVHRDVSPENVLVSFTGQVKLTDFGIAKSAQALDTSVAWGKPAYVAPEILDADPGSPASDLYSLGCVIYETLAGCPPLLAETEAETLRLVREEKPVPLAELREDVSEELSDLVCQILEKSPEDRKMDAADFEVSMSRLLSVEAPRFTETDLAHTLSNLFAQEKGLTEEEGEVFLAEQLREQLVAAGVETTGSETSQEILSMGTVALSPEPPGLGEDTADVEEQPEIEVAQESEGDEQAARGSFARWLGFLLLALLIVVGGGFALRELGKTDQRVVETDTGVVIPDAGTPDVVDAVSPIDGDVESDGGYVGSDGSEPIKSGGDAEVAKTIKRPPRPGTVTFNSHPWSFVFVNGRKLAGHTPIRNIKLPPGRHTIRFFNPELGLSKTTAISLESGASQFVKVHLEGNPQPPRPPSKEGSQEEP